MTRKRGKKWRGTRRSARAKSRLFGNGPEFIRTLLAGRVAPGTIYRDTIHLGDHTLPSRLSGTGRISVSTAPLFAIQRGAGARARSGVAATSGFAGLEGTAERRAADHWRIGGAFAAAASQHGELVNRLETAGLVKREADPLDGRGTLLRLTPRGAAKLRSLSFAHREELRVKGPQLARALKTILRESRLSSSK